MKTMKPVVRIIVMCACMLVIAQFSCAQEAYTLGVMTPKGIDVAKTEWHVKAVKSGAADAGFARTGFLEWLEEQGDVTVSDFTVIEPERDDYPYPHNGSIVLYSMFGAAQGTDAALARDVAAALKAMPDDSPAAKAANIYGWEDPADLALVREVLKNVQ